MMSERKGARSLAPVVVPIVAPAMDDGRWAGPIARWLILLLGLMGVGVPVSYRTLSGLYAVTVAYVVAAVWLTYIAVVRRKTIRQRGRGGYFLSYTVDIAFVCLIIYYSGGVSSEMYLLFAILALKCVSAYPLWHSVIVFPCVLGPLYVVVLRLSAGSWYFLTERFFLLRYGALLAVVMASLYVAWLYEDRQSSLTNLQRRLAQSARDLDGKTQAMQQMASSLGNRVQELRTLQEGLKAISSALALREVLRLIVANASQVLEGTHCTVVLLGEGHEAKDLTVQDSEGEIQDAQLLLFNRALIAWMARQGKSVLSEDLTRDRRFQQEARAAIVSLMAVPMFLGERVIGALSATSRTVAAFSTEDLNLLSAFADQAVVAVKNARLYEQLVQEQRQTAQLYRHVEERRSELEAILRGIGDGVIVTDSDLNLLLMNPVATRIFQLRPDITSSMPLPDVIPNAELVALFQEALHSKGKSEVREISLNSQDEAAVTIYQALASPFLDTEGRVRGLATVLRDVTAQKEIERMKSNFLSVVSHELKTPLHSIKGFVDIILMGKTGRITDTQKDFLQTVQDQATHLQNLINDLLEFSRLESGQVKLRLGEVKVAELAAVVCERLRPLAESGQIQLVNRAAPGVSPIVADQMRIEQVLSNLIDNAIKFTPPMGTVTVDASDQGEQVVVSVSDTGIGIPGGELEKIFDRFYQVQSGSTRKYRGTGLGLTICKHIVEYHQGRIWAESVEGKGSKFSFLLPKQPILKEDGLLLDFMTLPSGSDGEQDGQGGTSQHA
jgi:PAS domain S-box-containing protein